MATPPSSLLPSFCSPALSNVLCYAPPSREVTAWSQGTPKIDPLSRPSSYRTKVFGLAHGYLFPSRKPRRIPIKFTTVAPLVKNNLHRRLEHCVNMEDTFSTIPPPGEVHDCRVVVGCDIFLIVAHWSPNATPNLALKTTCGGLEWKGELSIVQIGKYVPFYRCFKTPSAVNAAVSR